MAPLLVKSSPFPVKVSALAPDLFKTQLVNVKAELSFQKREDEGGAISLFLLQKDSAGTYLTEEIDP